MEKTAPSISACSEKGTCSGAATILVGIGPNKEEIISVTLREIYMVYNEKRMISLVD